MKRALIVSLLAANILMPAKADDVKRMDAEARAKALVAQMSLDEKLGLTLSYTDGDDLKNIPDDIIPAATKAEVLAKVIPGAAGYVFGVERLGIPAQQETDASLGVRNPFLERVALPSSLATAASWDPKITESGGAMIGLEARQSGFNVMLAGGANLAREPRNGRNFEYTGEDPLLAADMAAGLVRGIQSNHIVSTVKHFAVNSQESSRFAINSNISESAMRQSDLLAFELLIEKSNPGAVMCSYNLVNGIWACENPYLLNQTLKQDWGFKGFVIADWGAVHSTVQSANSGLDQQAGYPCCGDRQAYFAGPLKKAVVEKRINDSRIDDMATRIVWALADKGVLDNPVQTGPIDFERDLKISQNAAEDSIVLLKNDRDLLPLHDVKSVAMIGGHADVGVLSGGGSSRVTPIGGEAVPNLEPKGWPGPVTYLPSSPMKALGKSLPNTKISYASGEDIKAAVSLAKKSSVAIVFVTQWTGEGFDVPLGLSGNQDALVSAVIDANPNTIVVIESGGAVLMPWADRAKAIIAAFYPGARGGEALANILTGAVNPSGHLPISFLASNEQLSHKDIVNYNGPDNQRGDVDYFEGAAIGYKWLDLKGLKPLFAFGHGLSYTQFALSDVTVSRQETSISATVNVKNTGKRDGQVVTQLYIKPHDFKLAQWEAPKRLGAYQKLALDVGQSRTVTLTVDPRLFAHYQAETKTWIIEAGVYDVWVGQSSDALETKAEITLPRLEWDARH